MLSFLVISLLMAAVTLGTFMYIPVMRGEEAFFGVRVNPEIYHGEGRRLLHQYYFWLIMTLVEIEAIPIIIALFRPQMLYARISWLVLFFPAAQILYTVYYHKVKPYAIIEEKQKFASAIINRKLADYTNVALEILIVLLILIPIPILAHFYPELPDKIPMHWNIKGEVDRWGQKSFGRVFALPIMMIYLQGLMLFFKHGLMQIKMTLPAEHTKEYMELKEEILRVTMKMMDTIRVLTAILMSGISFTLLTTIFGRPQTPVISIVSLSFMAVTLVVIIYFTYRIITLNRKLKEKTGRSYVQRQSDAERWYWGGMIYYNPDDSALWVEKLVGVGYTLNMGNKRVYLYIAYIALLPLIIRFVIKG